MYCWRCPCKKDLQSVLALLVLLEMCGCDGDDGRGGDECESFTSTAKCRY